MTAETSLPAPAEPPVVAPHDRVDVLGIHVSVTDLDDTVETFDRWISAGERHLVCVSDMNALLHARSDERLTVVYNNAGLTLADGMPLVWAGRRAGFGRGRRPRMVAVLLRRRRRGRGAVAGHLRPASSPVAGGGGLLTAVPGADRGRGRGDHGPDQRGPTGHRLGRAGSSEAGALDGRAP